MGTEPGTVLDPVLDASSRNQSAHWSGATSIDTATIAPVTAAASITARHSRRTANHNTPMPGVTLVSSASAQEPWRTNPTTNAAASRIVMLPPHSSGKVSTIRGANSSGPDSQNSTASRNAVQTTRNAVQGNNR